MTDIFDITEQVVVVTGSSGQLGLQYSKLFLENGAKVIGIDREVNQVMENFEKKFKNTFRFIKTDVTNKLELENALELTIAGFGIPSTLINNAAIDSPPGSGYLENDFFENYSEEIWDKVMEVNLKGVFLTCQVFGSAMAKNKSGSIINISSIYGLVSPDQSIYQYKRDRGEVFYKPISYSASKSGVLNLTRYLATYWARSGVRVNSLTLGGVLNNQEQAFLDSYCSRVPIGRMALEDEYNGAIIFLSSKASSYMTGSNLIIDGGWTAI